MNILVVGGHFYNKGAHLMLKAVVDELGQYHEHELFLSPCAGTKTQIKDLGYKTINFPLKHVTDYRGFEIFFRFGFFIKYLHDKYRGELPIEKIDVILDVSGFAYSDQWGGKAVTNVSKLIEFFKKRNAKYIFLPQAFGPFLSNDIKEGMKKVIRGAELVITRDRDSYNMLMSLENNKKIELYPDITIKVTGLKEVHLEMDNYSCIVPNERMLDQGRESWPEGEYIKCINKAIDQLLNLKNQKILILIHDKGLGDTKLAHFLKQSYLENDRVVVYYEENPVKLKSILGRSNVVIGSRFHALVSALSQNVPCMALSWSHKYKMLFKEYNIEEFSLDNPNEELFNTNMSRLLNDDTKMVLVKKISDSNVILQERNREMWSKIIKLINS